MAFQAGQFGKTATAFQAGQFSETRENMSRPRVPHSNTSISNLEQDNMPSITLSDEEKKVIEGLLGLLHKRIFEKGYSDRLLGNFIKYRTKGFKAFEGMTSPQIGNFVRKTFPDKAPKEKISKEVQVKCPDSSSGADVSNRTFTQKEISLLESSAASIPYEYVKQVGYSDRDLGKYIQNKTLGLISFKGMSQSEIGKLVRKTIPSKVPKPLKKGGAAQKGVTSFNLNVSSQFGSKIIKDSPGMPNAPIHDAGSSGSLLTCGQFEGMTSPQIGNFVRKTFPDKAPKEKISKEVQVKFTDSSSGADVGNRTFTQKEISLLESSGASIPYEYVKQVGYSDRDLGKYIQNKTLGLISFKGMSQSEIGKLVRKTIPSKVPKPLKKGGAAQKGVTGTSFNLNVSSQFGSKIIKDSPGMPNALIHDAGSSGNQLTCGQFGSTCGGKPFTGKKKSSPGNTQFKGQYNLACNDQPLAGQFFLAEPEHAKVETPKSFNDLQFNKKQMAAARRTVIFVLEMNPTGLKDKVLGKMVRANKCVKEKLEIFSAAEVGRMVGVTFPDIIDEYTMFRGFKRLAKDYIDNSHTSGDNHPISKHMEDFSRSNTIDEPFISEQFHNELPVRNTTLMLRPTKENRKRPWSSTNDVFSVPEPTVALAGRFTRYTNDVYSFPEPTGALAGRFSHSTNGVYSLPEPTGAFAGRFTRSTNDVYGLPEPTGALAGRFTRSTNDVYSLPEPNSALAGRFTHSTNDVYGHDGLPEPTSAVAGRFTHSTNDVYGLPEPTGAVAGRFTRTLSTCVDYNHGQVGLSESSSWQSEDPGPSYYTPAPARDNRDDQEFKDVKRRMLELQTDIKLQEREMSGLRQMLHKKQSRY